MADRDFFEQQIQNFEQSLTDFQDPRQEWRRLIAEFVGTFLLVLVAAGGAMVATAYPPTVSIAATRIVHGNADVPRPSKI